MRPHYPILDGLRGTAALLVVIFHLFEASFPVYTDNPMHHGYLAVDFFFLLSGFVVAYAYDDRWEYMSVIDFFKIRFVRLHPLVMLSVVISVLAFALDPYNNSEQIPALKIIGVTLLTFTLLPTPDLRGWGETHTLNGPLWSLFQEYMANIFYAWFGHRIGIKLLWGLVLISACVLTATAVYHGDIGTGWSYETFWIAFVRMVFPFLAGILLFRSRKLIRIPMAYAICSALLFFLFSLPVFAYNGLYDAVCIIFVFPFIIAAGAGGTISGKWAKVCKFSGDISYPIYIIHYPFIYIYTSWVGIKKPAPPELFAISSGLFILFIVLAFAALKLYDEPFRAWLKKRILK